MNRQLSIVIIAKNEEDLISRCVTQWKLLGEVIVLESGSSDNTFQTASRAGAKVTTSSWEGFGKQKQKAVALSLTDWVLSIDCDELPTPQLIKEIEGLALTDPSIIYAIRRESHFLGRKVRFSGWRHDYVLRLFNRTRANYTSRLVHEKVEGENTKTVALKHNLIHLPYRNYQHINRKTKIYAKLAGIEIASKRNAPYHMVTIGIKTFWAFFRTLIIQLGILDGRIGYTIAKMNGKYTFFKYLKANKYLREPRN